MKVAIDVSPLSSGHKIRGTGFYLKNLKENLEKKEKDLIFFNHINEIGKVDLIHFPYFDPFFITLPLKSPAPYVVTVHDLIPLVFPKDFPPGLKGRLKWNVQKRLLKNATAIITDSKASKNDIASIIGFNSENIHVVYLAASEKFKPYSKSEQEAVREKYNLPEKFALYVGDATANKNLVRLFNAIENLQIPLIAIGKALSDESIVPNAWNKDLRIAQEIARKSKFIKRLGFIEEKDLPIIYSAARVFAFPSLYEGFGLPVIEGMASGIPVVTTKGGSLKEVAEDAAVYVDGLITEDIAKGIKRVWDDDAIFEKYGQMGLNNAKRFSWNKAADETLAVYEKAIKSNK